MKLKRAIAAIVLASAFAAPVAAGPLEDAGDAIAGGDYATPSGSFVRWPMMAMPQPSTTWG